MGWLKERRPFRAAYMRGGYFESTDFATATTAADASWQGVVTLTTGVAKTYDFAHPVVGRLVAIRNPTASTAGNLARLSTDGSVNFLSTNGSKNVAKFTKAGDALLAIGLSTAKAIVLSHTAGVTFTTA